MWRYREMTDKRTGMPLDRAGEPDKQGQGVQGLAGERTENRGAPRPELQHVVESEEGPVRLEESSGTAFAEAAGAADKRPPDPDAEGGVADNRFPINARAGG